MLWKVVNIRKWFINSCSYRCSRYVYIKVLKVKDIRVDEINVSMYVSGIDFFWKLDFLVLLREVKR